MDWKNLLTPLMGGAENVFERREDGKRLITLSGYGRPSEDCVRGFRHRLDGEVWNFAEPEATEARSVEPGEVSEPSERNAPSALQAIGSVKGVTSSTSVDFYGTEMSLDALENMAEQLRSTGVPLLPAHTEAFALPEWDSVIGRSIDAQIIKGGVKKPYDEKEPGYVLDAEFSLFDVDKARDLRGRLGAGQPIGLSIGGWFETLTVIVNEDTDEVERVIVMAVKLDHVAATRMPANPDSYGLATLRSAIDSAVASWETPDPSLNVEAVKNRSSVTIETQPPHDLDKCASTGNDHDCDIEPVTRSEPESDQTPPETPMSLTPEQIAEIAARAAASAVEAVEARFTEKLSALSTPVPEPQPAPEPAAPVDDSRDDTIADLQAKIRRMESKVETLSSRPQRRGAHASALPSAAGYGDDVTPQMRSLVDSASAEGADALASVVGRNIETLSEADGPASINGKGSVRNLQGLLAKGLRAAEADGLLRGASTWR